MSTYTTIVPELDAYHVCPTSIRGATDDAVIEPFQGYFAFDPSKSLVGPAYNNSWISQHREILNQRINVDLGQNCIVTRIMYVNYHDNGGGVNDGAQYFQLWGSNRNIMTDAYDRGDGLSLIWSGKIERCTFVVTPATFPDIPIYTPIPKYILVNTEQTHYRFYALKMLNNWEGNSGIGLRRIELQSEDGIWP